MVIVLRACCHGLADGGAVALVGGMGYGDVAVVCAVVLRRERFAEMLGDRHPGAVVPTGTDPVAEVLDRCLVRVERDGGGLSSRVRLYGDDTAPASEGRFDDVLLSRVPEPADIKDLGACAGVFCGRHRCFRFRR